jgi:hypothetical protein
VHTRRVLTVQIAQVCTVVAMAGRIHDRGARLLRLLGVLTVVAGVFAMHGLTTDHNTAMAAPAPSASASAAMRHAAPAAAHLAPAELQVSPADEMDGMAGGCVAVLTGLVLLLALLLGLRSLLVWRALGMRIYVLRRVLGQRSPPGPVLSSLGVLRI